MTQEKDNYFFSLASLWGLWGLSSATRDQTHAPCTWTSREVFISYSVKVILHSQVCRNNFLKYILIYYFTSFNTKNENYLGQEWKLLLSRQDMQCKGSLRVFICTVLACDPWKGQRQHKEQASSWLCSGVIYLPFLPGSAVKEDQIFKNYMF